MDENQILFVFLLGCFIGNHPSAAVGMSATRRDAYFTGPTFRTLYKTDWLTCVRACQENNLCVSYNFGTRSGNCELSNYGIEGCNGDKMLVAAPGSVFQQLRQAPENPMPRGINQVGQCDCSCRGESACVTPEPDIALSCKDIWKRTSNPSNGPQYIKGPSSEKKTHVYCHMTELPGCGDGGWTLVMKINGSLKTFTYGSNWWTNKTSYNEQAGIDLLHQETKMASYWTTPFTSLCLGMQQHGDNRQWIKVDYKATSLFDVISTNHYRETGLSIDEWKSLLHNSSLQINCTKQGFNCDDYAKARIGIIGFNKCNSTSQSRIGFGTAGDFNGMNDANSCGNEASPLGDEGLRSITAFGYIFVK